MAQVINDLSHPVLLIRKPQVAKSESPTIWGEEGYQSPRTAFRACSLQGNPQGGLKYR
jgi:hypothetical protein